MLHVTKWWSAGVALRGRLWWHLRTSTQLSYPPWIQGKSRLLAAINVLKIFKKKKCSKTVYLSSMTPGAHSRLVWTDLYEISCPRFTTLEPFRSGPEGIIDQNSVVKFIPLAPLFRSVHTWRQNSPRTVNVFSRKLVSVGTSVHTALWQ